MYKNILLPSDGSECSKIAAEHAIDIADRYNSKLHILSVVIPLSLGIDVRSKEILDELTSTANDTIDEISEKARNSGVENVETVVEEGAPSDIILSYVSNNDIDLIVMGTHGRTGLERYLIGSVTERVVRKSEIPVLAIPDRDLED